MLWCHFRDPCHSFLPRCPSDSLRIKTNSERRQRSSRLSGCLADMPTASCGGLMRLLSSSQVSDRSVCPWHECVKRIVERALFPTCVLSRMCRYGLCVLVSFLFFLNKIDLLAAFVWLTLRFCPVLFFSQRAHRGYSFLPIFANCICGAASSPITWLHLDDATTVHEGGGGVLLRPMRLH